MLAGLLSTYEKNDFENFVADFTPAKRGRFSSCDHKFLDGIGFQGVKTFRVWLWVRQSKKWNFAAFW